VDGVTTVDVDERPWFVIHTFLHFASRDHLPVVRGRSWAEEFVSRLPESPPDMSKLKTRAAIQDAMVKMLENLDPALEPGST
ncbi:hypothetical protein, partial [Staphylococcus aureus]